MMDKEIQETDEREQFVLDFMDVCINNGCDMIKTGGALYDEGYRKINDVIKELLTEICDDVILYDECDEPIYAHDCVWYIELCKKYGVEVKE